MNKKGEKNKSCANEGRETRVCFIPTLLFSFMYELPDSFGLAKHKSRKKCTWRKFAIMTLVLLERFGGFAFYLDLDMSI